MLKKKPECVVPANYDECEAAVLKCAKKLKDPVVITLVRLITEARFQEAGFWEVIKDPASKRPKYRCVKCGKISPVPVKHCVECGISMMDDNGVVRKVGADNR